MGRIRVNECSGVGQVHRVGQVLAWRAEQVPPAWARIFGELVSLPACNRFLLYSTERLGMLVLQEWR